uniref:Uncharacterized protein n=1 Tax=Phaeocystis antarctica TaxID=33657 RepID=A0A7S0ND09_9EUKA
MRVPPPRLSPRLAPGEAACTASRTQAIAAALLLPPPRGAAPPPAHVTMLIPNLRPPPASAARALTGAVQRWGAALLAASVLTAAPFTPPAFAASASCDTSRVEAPSGAFRSAAFEKPNYSSAIVASRDTNVSPREAYDIIAERAVLPKGGACARALDLGAGAGVSTQLLWLNGFRSIEAVDPSRVAWDENVEKDGAVKLPSGVSFAQATDDSYLSRRARDPEAEPFEMVVVNYAINADKAADFARLLLSPEGNLLAPVNVQRDYWFAQEYRLMNQRGDVLWRKDKVGSWEVTFQPDFTQPTCQGQWCPQFRGADSLTTLELK